MTTTHDLALLRLVAQRVVGPPLPDAEATVRWLGAVQAQDLPGSVTSVALRTASRSADDVRAAYDAGRLVRTWPMRGTLHAVPAEDARWMVRLMTARPQAAAAKRRGQLGLTDDDVALAHSTLVGALSGGRALTRPEVLALWTDAGLTVAGGPGYHLIAHLAQRAVVCFGPWREGEQAVVLLDEWVPDARDLDGEEALGEVALRFFRSHGPATVPDLARWTGLPLRDVRAGLAVVAAQLTTLDVDGVTYHLDPATPDLLAEHADDARAVHLLPGFDEVVLGYADRSATVPPAFADRIVPGGNGVFRPTVLHDGVVVGTWRAGTKARRRLDLAPFDVLPAPVSEAAEERFAALPV